MLTKPLPYGSFRYMQNPEMYTSKVIMDLDSSDSATEGYIFIVDLKIPHDMKLHQDDMPLSLIVADEITPSAYTRSLLGDKKMGGRRLLAGHFDVREYGVHLSLLQFYIAVGCIVEKVHKVIGFAQKPYFKDHIVKCMRMRCQYKDDPIMSYMFKTFPNSLFGKTIMNSRKYSTSSSLVHARFLTNHMRDPFFRKVELVAKDIFLVTKGKSEVELNSPIYIGATVLQLAKLQNFRFHSLLAKPSGSIYPETMIRRAHLSELEFDMVQKSRRYIKSIVMCYTDTDSLHYEVTMNHEGRLY